MTAENSSQTRWTGITKGLLLGFVAMAVLLHQTFTAGGGFVPQGASQLMMWVAVVGIVAYSTLREGLAVGYSLAMLTGVVYIVFVGVLMAGLLGPLPEGGPLLGLVLGPIASVVFAVVLIASAVLARGERESGSRTSGASGESTAGAQ